MAKDRPELSKKSKYWIPKHRYYELKHFVMQKPDYELYLKEYESSGYSQAPVPGYLPSATRLIVSPTERAAMLASTYKDYISEIMVAAFSADKKIGNLIVENIVSGKSYETSKMTDICSRDEYYNKYRKFFWELSRLRE